MPKEIAIYLHDIVTSIDFIENYTLGLSKESFLGSCQLLQDGIIRRFEIIGEAVNRLPDSYKEKYPEIPWHKAVGLRNIIAHEYDRLDMNTIWETIKTELPVFKEQLLKAKLSHT